MTHGLGKPAPLFLLAAIAPSTIVISVAAGAVPCVSDGFSRGPSRRKVELFVEFPIEGLDMSPYCRGEVYPGLMVVWRVFCCQDETVTAQRKEVMYVGCDSRVPEARDN